MGEFQKRGFRSTKYDFLNIIDRLSFGRIFMFWIIMIIIFGFLYFLVSMTTNNALLYQGKAVENNMGGLFNSIYYSFITATTTGYGDISPQGFCRLLAIFEVIFGVIISGILISKLVGIKQEVILEEVYNISYEEVVDRLKNGLYLFRSDINRTMEKLDNSSIKQREIKDMWILFSGLDNSLTNIKNFIIPSKTDNYYSKKLDTLKLELLLNSIKLSMKRIVEFLRALKNHNIDWRNELLLTSIYYDVQVVNEIINFESKKTTDKKVIDRLNELRIIIADIEVELKPEKREAPKEEFVNIDKEDRESERASEEYDLHREHQRREPDYHEPLMPPVPTAAPNPEPEPAEDQGGDNGDSKPEPEKAE
jgi:potassium channel LctB